MHHHTPRRAARASTVFLAGLLGAMLAACGDPACEVDADCADENPCTADACSAGACLNSPDDALLPNQEASDDCLRQACADGAIVNAPDDAETPAQRAADDCARQACSGGVIVDLPADNETPAQVGAACLVEVCRNAQIEGEPAAPGAGGCNAGEFCDADAGCLPSLRDLGAQPGDATLIGDESFAQLTNFTGLAVADLNGDGLLDLALSEPDRDTFAGGGLREGAGEVKVVLGPVSGTLDLAASPPITIRGAAEGDRAGLALAACDFSGDGVDDLLIAAPNAEPNGGFGAGQVFGVLGPIEQDLDLFDLAVENREGLVISGLQPTAFAPDRLLCADLNGDNIDDILLGGANLDAPDRPGAGQVLVFLGAGDLTGARSFSQASLAIHGRSAAMHLGGALGLADLDGDGADDLVLGAPANGSPLPETVVLLANADLFLADGSPIAPILDLAADGNPAAFVDGNGRELFGFSLAGGDFDADGTEDVAISALLADPQGRANAGEVVVLYGVPGALSNVVIDDVLSGHSLIFGFDAGDETGISLAAGDHNGDNRDDLLLGAHLADGFNNARNASGESFLFLGGAALAQDQVIDLTQGGPGLVLFGANPGDALGKHLQMIDLNADGKDDLLLAAPTQDGPQGKTDAGVLHLLLAP